MYIKLPCVLCCFMSTNNYNISLCNPMYSYLIFIIIYYRFYWLYRINNNNNIIYLCRKGNIRSWTIEGLVSIPVGTRYLNPTAYRTYTYLLFMQVLHYCSLQPHNQHITLCTQYIWVHTYTYIILFSFQTTTEKVPIIIILYNIK